MQFGRILELGWEHAPVIVRFLIAGGTATGINFAILYTLTEFFHVWYLLSSVIGVSVGIVISFLLQKFWTFQNRPLERVRAQLSMYVALALFNLSLNTILLFMFVEYIHLWYIVGQLISASILATMNFFIYRLYIFV